MGLVPHPLIFNPVPGAYTRTRRVPNSYTITATQPVVWNWSSTGDLPTSNVANGDTASSITFTLSTIGESFITVTVGANTWTLDLTATEPPSGGGGP